MARYLYLCRHGQSQWNAKGILQGQLESPLSDLGREQALSLAHKAKHWDISNIVSSPLSRAKQTGQICADILQLSIQIHGGVKERNFAQWQGQFFKQLPHYADFQQRSYKQDEHRPCENAESSVEVQSRMLRALDKLARTKTPGNILLISHGDAIDCLLSKWTRPKRLFNGQAMRLVETTDSFTYPTSATVLA